MAGVVHRNLSPGNVTIGADGHIVLVNVVSAKLYLEHRRSRLLPGGTEEYQAPEVLLGWQHDFAVDCWGFGMLLYFMLCGTVSGKTRNSNCLVNYYSTFSILLVGQRTTRGLFGIGYCMA